MAPKFDVGAEINRMTAKSEMYFSIIQETYDISLQITTNTANLFLEQFDTAVQALSQLNLQDAFDFMITSMAFSKLDPILQEKFEHSYQGEFPKYQDLLKFLHKSQQAKNQVYGMTSITNNYTYDKQKDKNSKISRSFLLKSKYEKKCFVCREQHAIFACSKLLEMNIPERHKTTVACRSKKTCIICKAPHHTSTLLHTDKNLANTNQDNPSNSKSNNTVLCVFNNNQLAHNVTILPTAVTKVFTENENILLRTIIDSASARNFVTLTWCLKAQLPIKPVSAKAMGLGNSSQIVIGLVNFTLISLVNSYQLSVCAYVVHKIVGKQPQTTIPVSSIQTFLKYPLADPNFYSPQEVDGILGCDVFSEIIGTHQVKNDQGAPTALETQLGYIIIGSVPNLSQPSSTSTNLCNISNPDLNVQMDKFFQLEDIPQAALPYDDDYCENHFIATTKRSPEGRYIVALPFKIINDYLTQNHLSFVAPCSLKNKVNDSSHIENAYYIPHFAVEKESSSTPLRVVFDASAKNAEFTSLNENLHDRKYQRILWRPSPDVPIGIYELNTVTFGLSSSPFQAIRTIKQLSRDERSKFSESLIKILENDIYIDDVVTSVDSLENTKIIVRDRQIDFEIDNSTKVLGLKWNPLSDNFSFDIKLMWKRWTKRHLLSVIARIWDPLGFLTPIVIKIKILMKKIWTLKIDWDEELPSFIITSWLAIYSELELLNNFEIPRYLKTSERGKCTLFGFADSSEQAYGAVVYIRSLNTQNFMLISKSRVTPMKNQTLARLELCACPANRWKTFVANRVSKIHDLLPNAQWLHIPSDQNAADCVSRGLRPKQFMQHKKWLFGPDWLNDDISSWPSKRIDTSIEINQERKVNALV
ncbi:uncharacterized protein LOC113380637, partial [Ctenocephalides felis]|uniref:uncharacterized protein LOC113380637 n=1 Tax=Ctenocephalides felis TaxID=7515 RepID=UPI000E6E4580